MKLNIEVTLGDTTKIGDSWYEFSTAGNIFYGFYGKAAGFNEFELSGGAGLAQIIDLFEKGNIPGGPWTFFDTPDDYYAVLFGYYLFDNYFSDGILTESELADGLSKYEHTGKLAKRPEPLDSRLTPNKHPVDEFYN